MISRIYFAEENFLLVTGTGPLTEYLLKDHMTKLIKKVSNLYKVNIFIDTRGFEDAAIISSMAVFEIGVLVAAELKNVRKSVLLVNNMVSYGLSRAYILGSDEDYKRTVTYSMLDALAWLGYKDNIEQLIYFIDNYCDYT